MLQVATVENAFINFQILACNSQLNYGIFDLQEGLKVQPNQGGEEPPTLFSGPFPLTNSLST